MLTMEDGRQVIICRMGSYIKGYAIYVKVEQNIALLEFAAWPAPVMSLLGHRCC